MEKCFVYARVSGFSQISGDGIPRQIASCREYASRHALKISKIFREEGVSGETELKDRPALLALFDALASDGVKLVLIEKLDRLARDLMVQETIISDLKKHGFELISVMEPDLLQNDPTRILMRRIFGAIAEYEKDMIVAKLRAARQRIRARRGRCEGRRFYGEHDGEREILDRMREWRNAGKSFNRIAVELNEAKIPPRLGQRWHAYTVSKILARGESRSMAGVTTA